MQPIHTIIVVWGNFPFKNLDGKHKDQKKKKSKAENGL